MSRSPLVDQLLQIQSLDQLKKWQLGHTITEDLLKDLIFSIQDLFPADINAAMRLAEWMVALSIKHGDPFWKAAAVRVKGIALQRFDERQLSLDFFDEALRIFTELGNEHQMAVTRMNRMNSYYMLSRFDDALADADYATGVFERLQEDEMLGRHLLNVGHIYFRLDRFVENLEILDRAEQIMKQVGDTRALCNLYTNRAVALTSLNQAPEAFRYYGLAKNLAAENNMPIVAAQADYNICYLYFLQGQYTRALESIHQVRIQMEACGDRRHAALCNLDQSEIYLELNMHRDAIELAVQAYQAFEKLGMRYEMAKAVVFMGIAENHIHNYGKALELFDRARVMYQDQSNDVWLSLIDLYEGIVFFQTGRYFEGLELARSAFEFFDQAGLRTKATYARLLGARLNLQLHRTDDAWQDAQATLKMQGETPAPWLGYQIQYVIGAIHEERRQIEQARSSYRHAIEELEVLRTNIHVDELRMTFLKDKLRIYESFVRAGLASREPEAEREAFEAVERAKSRTLVDLLANNINAVPANKDSDSPIVERLRAIREELNWYYTRINLEEEKGLTAMNHSVQVLMEEVHKREDQLIRLLRQLSSEPQDYVTLHRVMTASLEEVQEVLPEDGVLIEYYMVDDQILAFIVTRHGFKVIEDFANAATLKTTFELLRFQLSKFALGNAYVEKFHEKLADATNQHLQDIYEELIRPLEYFLDGRKSVVFIPHDFLHYVPFHALYDGESYLIDRFEISYAPSASIYRSCVTTPQRKGGAPLLMGIPDLRTPFIPDEIRGIQSVYDDARVYLNGEATAERLQQWGSSASFIHIASHGSFRRDNPMFSSIQLGDTWLSLFDIYNLKTTANLVTLSGCGTGMSSIVAGDELLGLVRGFLYAGARSLVVSLWDVNDRTTADMMSSFYRNFASGQTVAAALREAMLEMKTSRPHPYYWAPFILVGRV